MSTDVEWEWWGKEDPYYGVLTLERFRMKNLTPELKQSFFASGRLNIEAILASCREHLDDGFSPRKVLDFGCGTGRLVIPFAQMAESVVGVDVSESMLKECRKNCDEHLLTNVTLVKSDDELSALEGKFDFIYSMMVLQHIPIYRGLHLLTKLLEHLEEGGIGTIQITYAKASTAREMLVAPPPPPPPDSTAAVIWNEFKRIFRPLKRKLIKPPELPREPEMQMNAYNVNALFFLIHSLGVQKFHVEFTDHGGELGAFFFFQKPKS